MSALSRHVDIPLLIPDWHADVAQLLDDHHLVAWSEAAARRTQFAVNLAQFLGSQQGSDVCVLYGRFITDLESFCHQLERAIPGPALERRLHGPRGAVSLLRSRPNCRGRAEPRYRYYIWHDADVLLKADSRLFGQIADAFAGVAAEAEFATEDLLLLHRAVFVGSSMLDVYYEDLRGQFRCWASDGHAEPFWQVVTGVKKPPYRRFRVDALKAEGRVA